jgi:hypothetical protein
MLKTCFMNLLRNQGEFLFLPYAGKRPYNSRQSLLYFLAERAQIQQFPYHAHVHLADFGLAHYVRAGISMVLGLVQKLPLTCTISV